MQCSFWHTRLLNVAGIRIWSRLVAKSGQAKILKLLFWRGIFEILAKTLVGAKIPIKSLLQVCMYLLIAGEDVLFYTLFFGANVKNVSVNHKSSIIKYTWATVFTLFPRCTLSQGDRPLYLGEKSKCDVWKDGVLQDWFLIVCWCR